MAVPAAAGAVNRHFTHHFPCSCALTALVIEGLVALGLTRHAEGKKQKRGSLFLLMCLQNAEHTKNQVTETSQMFAQGISSAPSLAGLKFSLPQGRMKGTIVELSLGLFGKAPHWGRGRRGLWEEQLLFVVHYGRWLEEENLGVE